MLSKTRAEESSIRTVKLARGTYSGLSPPGVASVTSARSSERSSIPRTVSPDGRDRNDPLRLLGSVGVVELLEQDTRPTFVVDIGDTANHSPAQTPLQILFANSALRSNIPIWDLVAGKTLDQSSDEPTVHASTQFRGWLLSTIVQGESLDINPPPVEHGGTVWSCYTLRKRLRVVSGSTPTSVPSSIPSTSASNEFAIASSSSPANVPPTNGIHPTSAPSPTTEALDYFGGAVPTVTEDRAGEPIPTPEAPPPDPALLTPSPMDTSGGVIVTRPIKVDMPPSDSFQIFTNECVLGAQSAGDVDPFYRESTPAPDHDIGFFDWTRLPVSSSMPRHIQFARSIDWASTSLGPIEYWTNDLRTMCNLIM
jgi:hypothetical protein